MPLPARTRLLPAAALVLCLGATAATCGRFDQEPKPAPKPASAPAGPALEPVPAPDDLGARAYRHAEQLVSYGPRHPGSAGWSKAIAYIAAELREAGLEPSRDRWTDPVEKITFENVSAVIPGRQPERIVIGAHHDTKKTEGHPDPAHNYPFVGANDSGSGVGLLLALARHLAKHPHRATVEVVFFDGEESIPYKWDKSRALFGSRRYVRKNTGAPTNAVEPVRGAIAAFVLLDMVGAEDLQIDDESNSDPTLKDIFRRAAHATGHAAYFFVQPQTVSDDHLPFLDAGIPAIDLIDLADNPQWHTKDDTLEHLSPKSMQIVGEVVLTALPEIERVFVPRRAKDVQPAPAQAPAAGSGRGERR